MGTLAAPGSAGNGGVGREEAYSKPILFRSAMNDLMKLSVFAYSWVYGPMGQILQQKAASTREYPNIQPGEDFTGYR